MHNVKNQIRHFSLNNGGDCEKEAKAKIVDDDVVLAEVIENKKEFPIHKT